MRRKGLHLLRPALGSGTFARKKSLYNPRPHPASVLSVLPRISLLHVTRSHHTPHLVCAPHITHTMLALRARALAIPRSRSSSRIVLAARIRYYSVVVDAPRPGKTKVWDSVDEAVKDVKAGDIILSGGSSRVSFATSRHTLTS